VAVQLAQNALLDLQTVKDELGIGDTSSDGLLTRRINVASAAIESYCNRSFRLQRLDDYTSVPSTTPPRAVTRQRPLLLVVAITEYTDEAPGTVVDPADYGIEDAYAGEIYRATRWRRTSLRRPDIVQDWDPGTERESLLLTVVGGWVTLPQAMAAPARPADGSAVLAGALLRIGTAPNELLWLCTVGGVLGVGAPAGLSAGGALSTMGKQGLVAGAQVVDGAATWTLLGTVGAGDAPGTIFTANTGRLTGIGLPSDLEQAALETVVMHWRRRGQNTEITSESLLGASASYAARAQFPPSAIPVLDYYKRRVVA
jgi:hypothetical protein